MEGDWLEDSGRRRGPVKSGSMAAADVVVFDSVTGTEADLAWAHPRLRANGANFGRQYVTFNPWQAYPTLELQLVKRRREPN